VTDETDTMSETGTMRTDAAKGCMDEARVQGSTTVTETKVLCA
jgi:hypothetical protein